VLNLISDIKGSLKVYQNRVLGRIYGSKRDKILRVGKKLYNEKLLNLNSSPNIIRLIESKRKKWAVACMGRREMNIGFWWERQKRRLGKPRLKWEDNIKTDFRELGGGNERSNSIKC
jgi:hypothetical protein